MNHVVITIFCIVIAIYDLKTLRIPDAFIIIFSIAMILTERNILNYINVSHFAALTLSFLLFGSLWCYTQGIGFGDVKFASILGFFLGMENIVYAFFITACTGILIYLIGVLILQLPKNTKIPYAPFLSAGALFAIGSVT